jgi:hypothetical protein
LFFPVHLRVTISLFFGYIILRKYTLAHSPQPDIFVPDYTIANWGTNYPHLLEIKEAVDPTGQLLVVQGVGAVGWDEEQICRTK